MNTTGNTLLITGGGTGIGRGLAEAFHRLGNKVIVAGRRPGPLAEVTRANLGIASVTLHMEDPDGIRRCAAELVAAFPKLSGVIHSAGIMKPEDIKAGELTESEATIQTNLLGPIRLTAALLPHLLKQPHATIMTVSSGLAFVPLARTPTYSATKAAIHSYTQSLRFQLRATRIQVLELIPPYVQTELTGPHQATDPDAMPLADYLAEVMQIIQRSPDLSEICVERVKPLRLAEQNGKHDALFAMLNEP